MYRRASRYIIYSSTTHGMNFSLEPCRYREHPRKLQEHEILPIRAACKACAITARRRHQQACRRVCSCWDSITRARRRCSSSCPMRSCKILHQHRCALHSAVFLPQTLHSAARYTMPR